MRLSAKTLTTLGIFTAIVSLSACGAGQTHANATDSLTLKTYTVPDGRAKDLSQTLNHVLAGSGKNRTGRAWYSGSQQLLVLAPRRMQDSIASSIKAMIGKNPTSTEAPRPYRLNAWIVAAYPGEGVTDPALQTIQPALSAFSRTMGSTHFKLVHYLTAVSDTGSHSIIAPFAALRLHYTIEKRGSGLALYFDYDNTGRRLQSEVTTQLGQTLVLGLIYSQSVGTGKTTDNAGNLTVPQLLVMRITPATQS